MQVDSFIVSWTSALLRLFHLSTITGWLRRCLPEQRSRFVIDCWNLAGLFIACACASAGASIIAAIIGFARIWEILICQANVLFYTDKERGIVRIVKDPRRLLSLAVLNYVEMIMWFSVFYRFWAGYFDSKLPLGTPLNSLYFSVVTATTLGFGDIAPNHAWGGALVTIELMISIFMTLMVLARFVAILRTDS